MPRKEIEEKRKETKRKKKKKMKFFLLEMEMAYLELVFLVSGRTQTSLIAKL